MHSPGTFLLIPSLAFDSSVAGLFGTLGSGGTLVLVPQSLRADAAGLGRMIARHRVTQLATIPAIYRLLLSESPPSQLASLGIVIVGSETCPPELVGEHCRTLPRTRAR